MDKINKNTYIMAAVALVGILAAIYFLFVFHKKPKEIASETSASEVRKIEDIELSKRPFATLTPTSDGAEIILSLENMQEFTKIDYELTYLADNPQISGEKIERGSTGTDVNTKDAKYKKSILLGTASKGVRSPDKNVSGGKLTIHAFKNETEYQSETTWNLQKAGAADNTLTDASKKFSFTLPTLDKDYWFIVADTLGLPPGDKEFKEKDVVLPVWGVFSTLPPLQKSANFSISKDFDLQSPLVFAFDHQNTNWQKIDATYDSASKTLKGLAQSLAVFVVVSAK